MNYNPNVTPEYSQLERRIVYDFWFNPDQTMRQLAEKYNSTIHKVTRLTSHFIKLKQDERDKLFKAHQNDP
jgi:hypothetical protein